MTQFNKIQLELFDILLNSIRENNIDITKIKILSKLPEFKICRNIFIKIYQKKIEKKDDETYVKIINHHLQNFLIEYIKEEPAKFTKKIFNLKIKLFENYLNSFQNTFFYFSPLYNFDLIQNELIINKFIKIRHINKMEKNYLLNYYANFFPIKILLTKIKYVIVISLHENLNSLSGLAKIKILETLNKLKLLGKGNINSGGLYVYDGSEDWNPSEKFTRIEIENTGIISQNKYFLKKLSKTKMDNLFTNIDYHYPSPRINKSIHSEKEIQIIENYLEKYADHFSKVINRFCGALDKDDESERIVDYVLCLETLLVSSPGDSTMKLSQRLALFLGKTDVEKYEIWQYMKTFYDFRSGQIHELSDRSMNVPYLPQISKDDANKKLEIWTRYAILKMIFFSQLPEFTTLSIKQLFKKIDESMFNSKLKTKFLKLDIPLKQIQ